MTTVTNGHLAETTEDTSEQMEEVKCLHKWNRPQWKGRLAYTGCLYFVMIAYGWNVAIKGPSLLDLGEITRTDIVGTATFVTSGAIGSVAGSIVGGSIYDRFNKKLTIFFSVLLFGVTCAVIPYCTSYWSMVVMFFLNEFLIGGYKTGANVEILRLWVDDSKRVMQGLHFCYSLGASISPLVLQPFLSDEESVTNSNITQNLTLSQNWTDVENNGTDFGLGYQLLQTLGQNISGLSASESNIHYAYVISGTIGVVAALAILVALCLEKKIPTLAEEPEKKKISKSEYPKHVIGVTFILFFLLYFFLDEVEDSSPTFLSTFVNGALGWSRKDGAAATGAFWIAFTVGRLVGTISMGFMTHFQFFVISSCCLFLAQTGLLLSGLFHFNIGVWLSVILAGLSVAVILPASLTWMEKEFVTVSGKIVSAIYVALSIGGMANPQLIGYLMQHVTYMGYCYVLLTETVLFALTLVGLKLFHVKVLLKYKPNTKDDDDITTVSLRSYPE